MILFFAVALLCGASALPTIISSGADSVDCLNGISCAQSQTCMSNLTGAGMRVHIFSRGTYSARKIRIRLPSHLSLQYACAPLPNAVRCMDARFSCPASTVCAEEIKCVAADGTVTDGILNVDAFGVAEFRDFGV